MKMESIISACEAILADYATLAGSGDDLFLYTTFCRCPKNPDKHNDEAYEEELGRHKAFLTFVGANEQEAEEVLRYYELNDCDCVVGMAVRVKERAKKILSFRSAGREHPVYAGTKNWKG